MPNIVATNISNQILHLRDLYITLYPNTSSTSIYRTYADLSKMSGLLEYESLGLISVSKTNTEIELSAPFSSGDNTVKSLKLNTPDEYNDFTIYVRTNGNDLIGNGSLISPYATLQKALASLPTFWHLVNYKIDITGMDIEIPSGYNFPQFINYNPGTFEDNSFGFFFKGPLQIYAEPILLETVEVSDISGTVLQANTDQIQYNVSKTWTTNEFQWLFAVDSINNIAGIISNSTNNIKLASSAFTPPFRIYTQSATLRNETGESLNILNITSNMRALVLSGIKFISNDESNGLLQTNSTELVFQGCQFKCSLDLQGNAAFWGSSIVGNDSNIYLSRGSFDFNQTIINDLTGIFPDKFTRNLVLYSSSISNSGSFPGSVTNLSLEYISAYGCHFTGSIADAISIRDHCLGELENCLIENTTGNATSATNNGATLVLSNVGGSGNSGFGTKISNGASCSVSNDGVLVTGTGGDLKVGTLSVRTWTNFRGSAPVKNQVDFTALTGDGSRAYQA